jgi:hypothetical protein
MSQNNTLTCFISPGSMFVAAAIGAGRVRGVLSPAAPEACITGSSSGAPQ